MDLLFLQLLSKNTQCLSPAIFRCYSVNTHDADLVVIGSGPGGYVGAIKAAQLGMKVHTQLSIIITKQSFLLLGLIEDSILDFIIWKPDFLVQFTNGFQTPNHRIPTVLKLHMQCRSEIGTFQDFKWSKRGCFTNSLNFECGLKSGSPTILNRDKWPPFCQTGPFEIPSLKYSDFQCFSVSNDQISDPRCLSLQNVFFSTTAVYL